MAFYSFAAQNFEERVKDTNGSLPPPPPPRIGRHFSLKGKRRGGKRWERRMSGKKAKLAKKKSLNI